MSADRQRGPGGVGKKRRARSQVGDPPGALDLVEEAVQLLRAAPAEAWLAWCLGVLPFHLGALAFWVYYSIGNPAQTALFPVSVGLAILFAWMKAGQVAFAERLLAARLGKAPGRFSLRGWLGCVGRQAAWQPTEWVVFPVAFLLTIPLGAAWAYYQHLTVMDTTVQGGPGAGLGRKAWAEARRWPGQAFALFGIVAATGFLVFVNVWGMFFLAPYLLKAVLGWESLFTRNSWTLFSSPVLATSALAGFLASDALTKAVFVLRTFYGRSLQTGEDLMVKLQDAQRARGPGRRPSGRASAAVLLAAGWLAAGPGGGRVEGAETPAPAAAETAPASGSPAAEELDAAIDRTLQRPEFSWRLPEPPPDWEELELRLQWLEDFVEMIREWLDKLRPKSRGSSANLRGQDWNWQEGLTVVLGALAALALAWVAWLLLRPRGLPAELAAGPGGAAVPDLEAENLSAEQLPRNEWIRLALELRAKGELRLALRALFLGQLSLLHETGIIALARYKSNIDYLREVRRRAQAHVGLLEPFQQNLTWFEASWYGDHPVELPVLDRFTANLEALEASAR